MSESDIAILAAAGRQAGVLTAGANLIRNGSNRLYRLPNSVVARIGRVGQQATAEREVTVARWLADSHLPAVRPIAEVAQPTVVHDQPVTWWELLPPHRTANPQELGQTLRSLHSLQIPDNLNLPDLNPFEHLAERIDSSTLLDKRDQDWLTRNLNRLHKEYTDLVPALPRAVVHGDAWQGNVAVPDDGGDPTLLDFEHVSVGSPEWDLVPVAADYVDFARLSEAEYQAFAEAYGFDVTTWQGFRTLADIVELRWTVFVLDKAEDSVEARQQFAHRLACLRGDIAKPWSWNAF